MPNPLEYIDLDFAHLMGGIGGLIFYGRFYLQWYTSEKLGRSVVPIGFWYMSCIGALLLFGYGVYTKSALGTLSYCFNIVIYIRNLIHVWRANGTLSRRRANVVHGLAAVLVLVAAVLLFLTWLNVLEKTPTESSTKTWFWIGVGVVGQGLFACRFLIQWLNTERRKESVIPVAFWYLSVVASALMMASFIHTREWIYVLGMTSTLPIYARNLWLIHRRKQLFSEST